MSIVDADSVRSSIEAMARKKITELTLANDIRAAIALSGLTANEFGRETGIPQSTITRFLQGKNMGVDIAGKVVAYFGMRLEPRSVPPPKSMQVVTARGDKYLGNPSKAGSKSKRSRRNFGKD